MDILQFIADRYNYWVVIVLMMLGLYTVISRGNLVKKIIGLNIFQTSVFIYYISIGKIRGGTAPIYVPGDMEARTDHGDDHGSGHGAAHGEDVYAIHGEPANAMADAVKANASSGHETVASTASLHAEPTHHAGASNSLETDIAFNAEGSAAADPHGASEGGVVLGEVIYSNPLPHVLILTAIVVGVATTAVGLALAVRIREAYGTIEEDELEAADNIAEFGTEDPREAAAGAAA
ncbi:MAG: cation:proton antiporter subunit C [Pseudomonadota bacterium]